MPGALKLKLTVDRRCDVECITHGFRSTRVRPPQGRTEAEDEVLLRSPGDGCRTPGAEAEVTGARDGSRTGPLQLVIARC